jgi:hypothetical protein
MREGVHLGVEVDFRGGTLLLWGWLWDFGLGGLFCGIFGEIDATTVSERC